MNIRICNPLLLLFLVLPFLISCEDDGFLNRDRKPEHSGELGEVLLVIDKPYWDGILVSTIKDSLEKLNYSLPQPEPFMNVRLVSNKHFTASSNTHHTILYIELMPESPDLIPMLDGPRLNVWAKNQVMYKIYARSEAEALNVFIQNYYALQESFENRVKELALLKVSETVNQSIIDELALTLKLTAKIPKGFKIDGNFSDMIWLSQLRMRYADGNDHEVQLGVLVYSYPYLDSLSFSADWQLNKRDSITKKYIKGSLENSYMLTERSEGIAKKEFMYKDNYTFELRGLWKMQNALMGGPFMSVSFFDKPNNRIVTIDGYVFAPYFKKMEYMRELEAILYSFTAIAPEKN